MALELLWRGRSHHTMFLLGGACFLLLGKLNRTKPRLNLPGRMLAGSAVCTSGELLFGLLFNRGYGIWDYRGLPWNLGGQICLLYSLLWMPLSLAAMWLYEGSEGILVRVTGRMA